MSNAERNIYYYLFKIIVENNDPDTIVKIVRDLYSVHWMISSNHNIKYYLDNVLIPLDDREQILLFSIEKLLNSPSEYTIAFLVYLLRKNLFHKLSYIIHIFKYYFAQETSLLLVEVVSKHPVDESVLNYYKEKIALSQQKRVEFIYKYIPNMLGGFKLRWHEGEIDATLRKRVDTIKYLITQRKE